MRIISINRREKLKSITVLNYNIMFNKSKIYAFKQSGFYFQ